MAPAPGRLRVDRCIDHLRPPAEPQQRLADLVPHSPQRGLVLSEPRGTGTGDIPLTLRHLDVVRGLRLGPATRRVSLLKRPRMLKPLDVRPPRPRKRVRGSKEAA